MRGQMGPSGNIAGRTQHRLRAMLEGQVLAKALVLLEGDEALHAHQVLVVGLCGVVVKRLLVTLRLETNFTRVVFCSNVGLKV